MNHREQESLRRLKKAIHEARKLVDGVVEDDGDTPGSDLWNAVEWLDEANREIELLEDGT